MEGPLQRGVWLHKGQCECWASAVSQQDLSECSSLSIRYWVDGESVLSQLDLQEFKERLTPTPVRSTQGLEPLGFRARA